MPFTKSLVGKSVLITLAVIIACMVLLFVASRMTVSSYLNDAFQQESENTTHFLSSQINTGTRLKRGAMIEPQLFSALQAEGLAIVALRVTHTDGTEVANMVTDGVAVADLPPLPVPDFETPANSVGDRHYLTSRSPILLGAGADEVTVGELTIIWDRAPTRSSISNLMLLIAAIIAITTLAIATTIAVLLQRKLARPLSAIVEAMSAAVDGKDDVALPDGGSAEMDAMVAATGALQTSTRERATLIAELAPVLDAARSGDFGERLPEGDNSGDIRGMVNDLLGSVEVGLEETVRVFGRLAQGDLSVRMDGDFQGAFAELQDHANTTAKALSATVDGIADGATEIEAEASKMDDAAKDMAARTQTNAATLEETSAAVRSIADALKDSAQKNAEAQKQTQAALSRAADGERVVAETVASMGEIHRFSAEISQIIGLIDDVAFQTNLLALNAGVEAARAGDAGKGFAVVASEVRALAQRASESASQINTLISDSSIVVEKGVKQVDAAGAAIGDILKSIEGIADQMASMAQTSEAQSASVDEISTAVEELDRSTQANAIMVDETTSRSSALSRAASGMTDRVAAFGRQNPYHESGNASVA